MILRTLLAWFLLLAVAVANGFVREAFITPKTGRGLGHAISTVMLSLLIIAIGWLATIWIGPASVQDAWTIGVGWLLCTLAFEFFAGHFVFGRTWPELFADYNLLAGRIWIMVLVVTLMTPVIAFSTR